MNDGGSVTIEKLKETINKLSLNVDRKESDIKNLINERDQIIQEMSNKIDNLSQENKKEIKILNEIINNLKKELKEKDDKINEIKNKCLFQEEQIKKYIIKENNLKCKINSDYLNEILKNENNIILFGAVGTGKTTFLNKICGTNFKVGGGGFSCTREVEIGYANNRNMLLIDFPGILSSENILDSLKIYVNILNIIPTKMICLFVQFSLRYDEIIRNLSIMLNIFKNYIENIVFIVSYANQANLSIKSEIEFIIKKKFKIENIIFFDTQNNSIDLINSLEKFKNKMKKIPKLILQRRDFFSLIGEEFNFDFIDEREKYGKEFNKALELFKNEFCNAQDDDLKRAIYFGFKNYKENLIEKYLEEIKKKNEDIDSIILEIIMFNNQIYNEFASFTKYVERNIKIKLSNNNDVRCNTFKKCPYCGTIWIQTEGCNDIICGGKSPNKDFIYGMYKDYLVKYEKNKIVISTENKGNNIIGCGNSSKWDEMEDCTEQVQIFLKEIFLSDYDSEIINIAEKLGMEGL